MHLQRIQHLLPGMTNNRIDGMMVSNVSNIRYLTGFSGDSSILILTKDHAVLLTDARYIEQARSECPLDIEVCLWKENIRYGAVSYQYFIDNWEIKNLGFEEKNITYSSYLYLVNNLRKVNIIGTSGLIEKLRLIKDEYEIGCIKKACEISDRAIARTLKDIKAGSTELEVAALLEYNMRLEGAENISFETVLLSGRRTSLLHGKPSMNKLQEGDSLLFDYGALVDGYHADISRTVFLGKPTAQQIEIYNIIRECKDKVINSIKHEVNINIPNKIVNTVIPDKYKAYFYSGYGHGVGLDIHEEPFMKDISNFEFMAGMVHTVEPGIYLPNWGGIRIEDTILVTHGEPVYLSNYTTDIIIL
jgi:Xaa-Pro aminopeptidase